MAGFLGMSSLEQLLINIPAAVAERGLDLAPGQSEPDVADYFSRLTRANKGQARRSPVSPGAGATTTRFRR